jgi:hypothetical protein
LVRLRTCFVGGRPCGKDDQHRRHRLAIVRRAGNSSLPGVRPVTPPSSRSP